MSVLGPEVVRAQDHRRREAARRALEGDETQYVADLRQQGEAYARQGISLGGWHDLIRDFQQQMVPMLVAEYGRDPTRLCGALDGMHAFVDRAMVVIGQAYIARKEELLVEQRLHWFIDSVQDYAVLVLEPDGVVATWNAGAERLTGYRADEIIGQHFSRFYTPEDLAKGKPELGLRGAAATGRFEDEGWRLRKNGTRFWANVVITAVRDGAGRLQGFGKVTRDFSERHRAEEERASANRFLDSVLESLPVMVFVKDARDLRFVRFNKAGEELLGIAREELIGKSDHDLFPKSEADFFVHKDREVLQKGELVTIAEEPLQTRHGQRFLYTKKIPILDDDGQPRYLVGISLDITDARLAQHKLEQAMAELETLNRRLGDKNEELVRVNRAKSDFLAMMSHELRTPLNSIIGFSEVLLDQKFGALNQRQSRYVHNVNDSGRHLLILINDLLDLSKIEAGRLDVVLHPCAPRALVADAVGILAPLADRKRIQVEVDAPGKSPLLVTADAARFKQVLYNLLSNALKFTAEGGHVEVTCAPAPEAGWVRTSVIDDGSGIASDDLARLFNAFTQLDNAKDKGGTGLGLALTRQLVELMGGRIGVTSAVGVGSTFWVDLPLHASSATSPPLPSEGGDAPLALIVDDDPAARELLLLALRGNGFRAVAVATAEEALEEARRQRPDVITLDLFLQPPSIDGWDLLRVLKTDAATAEIPVVMVSISSDRAKAFSLGAIEHLVKPVAREALIEALARRSFTTKVKTAPVHVLAIDDDQQQLELYRATLEPRGFVVRAESSARAGIEHARHERVDLVLLDLVMPEMSGIEVVADLRAIERTRATPILLVTAHELSVAERARLNGDVAAVVSKSAMRIEDLVSEIGRVLRGGSRTSHVKEM